MNGFVVKEGGFGHRRKAACCGKTTRAGESVLAFEKRVGGAAKGHLIVHRRCILDECDKLPMDAADTKRKMNELRDRIIKTGNPFPDDVKPLRRKRGPRELAEAS